MRKKNQAIDYACTYQYQTLAAFCVCCPPLATLIACFFNRRGNIDNLTLPTQLVLSNLHDEASESLLCACAPGLSFLGALQHSRTGMDAEL